MPDVTSFHGLVEFAPGFTRRAYDQPRVVRLRRHALADPAGLARDHDADVRRDAAAAAGGDPRSPPAALQRRHHAAQREADHLPDDPVGRAHQGTRRHAARAALVQARIPAPAGGADSATASRACATGHSSPDDLLVYGARALLEALKRRGLPLYLASGTDEYCVKAEAELLDMPRYFGRHIYGAIDDYKKFSKKMVIERILRENAIQGDAAPLLRRRLRGDREHQGGRRLRGGRGQRRGAQRLGTVRRVEAEAAAGRGRRYDRARFPGPRGLDGVHLRHMTPERFNAITGQYRRLSIAIAGDFCLDRYLEIDPARQETSLETGLPVYNVANVRAQPGGSGTILNNLVALGMRTIFPVGFAGEDGEGYELRRALAQKHGRSPGPLH